MSNHPPSPAAAPDPVRALAPARSGTGWQRMLPADPKRRLRTVQTAMACLFTVGGICFMAYGVLVDAMTLAAALTWSSVAGLGGLAFIIVMRNGWSERLADPSMTVGQMVFAISCCAWA